MNPFKLPTLLVAITALAGPGAWAGDSRTLPSLPEIRERERQVEQRRIQNLKQLEGNIEAQAIDPGEATQIRARIEEEARTRQEILRRQKEEAQMVLETQASKTRPDSSARATSPSSALPRFPSTQVVTYPPLDPNAPEAVEKPSREGRQKNVGIGVRELEF